MTTWNITTTGNPSLIILKKNIKWWNESTNINCMKWLIHNCIKLLDVSYTFLWMLLLAHVLLSHKLGQLSCPSIIIYLHNIWWSVTAVWIHDSKVHGANMGLISGRQDPGGPHLGPMNFAIWNIFATLSTCRWFSEKCTIGLTNMHTTI